MVYIINSAPGVGKSTLLRELQGKFTDRFALNKEEVSNSVCKFILSSIL